MANGARGPGFKYHLCYLLTLGKLLNSDFQFSLLNGGNQHIYLTVLLWKLNKAICISIKYGVCSLINTQVMAIIINS